MEVNVKHTVFLTLSLFILIIIPRIWKFVHINNKKISASNDMGHRSSKIHKFSTNRRQSFEVIEPEPSSLRDREFAFI